jgi:hypothetical protein
LHSPAAVVVVEVVDVFWADVEAAIVFVVFVVLAVLEDWSLILVD